MTRVLVVVIACAIAASLAGCPLLNDCEDQPPTRTSLVPWASIDAGPDASWLDGHVESHCAVVCGDGVSSCSSVDGGVACAFGGSVCAR